MKRLIIVICLFSISISIDIYAQEVDDSYYSPQKVFRDKELLFYGHICASTLAFISTTGMTYDHELYDNEYFSGFNLGFKNIGIDFSQFIGLSETFGISLTYKNETYNRKLKKEDDDSDFEYINQSKMNTISGRLYFGKLNSSSWFGGYSYSFGYDWLFDYGNTEIKIGNQNGLQFGFQNFISSEVNKGRHIIMEMFFKFNWSKGNDIISDRPYNYYNYGLTTRASFIPALKWKLGLYGFGELNMINGESIKSNNDDNNLAYENFNSMGVNMNFGLGLAW